MDPRGSEEMFSSERTFARVIRVFEVVGALGASAIVAAIGYGLWRLFAR